MIELIIIPNGDDCWPDLQDKAANVTWLNRDARLSLARLPNGTSSGASSVALRVDLPDGRVVVVETSMKLFLSAARVFTVAEEKA